MSHAQLVEFIEVTLDSGIDVGQEINVGHEKFDKKNKHRALNKGRACKMWQKFQVFCNEKIGPPVATPLPRLAQYI